ncbi:hypothetical protein [Brevundimonas sp. EYE_349]|uniref:hypothetical protein n=1 Tax=Brevundimonas sp. EYE_349 TaxID=2853455 RepID=UPI0020031694|nr:hypothetical protein [Brevundimonas sp. EYE_349]MCK6105276.1 hypothetical protein [Brevundimonas sp. EYE_349]
MRSSPALRSLLLAAVGSTVLAGAAAAQSTANTPTTVDDVRFFVSKADSKAETSCAPLALLGL